MVWLLRRPHTRALSSSAPPPVVITQDAMNDAVRVLTLSRPSNLNAMTVTMGDAVESAVSSLRDLPPSELKAVVITGEGRAFSAGGDLAFLESRGEDTRTSNAAVMMAFYKRFLSIRTLPVPVIACINGPAIGAGLCFAMAADIRVTHDAAMLGFTFVGLGLHPGMGCTHTITAACGSGQVASRLLLTGDVVTGTEAARLGLVASSLPDSDKAMVEALDIARRIASQSPLAVRATTKTLRHSLNVGLDAALQREADEQALSYASRDYAEGLSALREKRPPAFPGE